MKALTEAVFCVMCGKRLKGTPALPYGWHVRHHKTASGKPCWGRRRTDHRRAAS